MVRLNSGANADYGATRHPPPPYSQFLPATNEPPHPNPWLPVVSRLSLPTKTIAPWTRHRWFVALLTFFLGVGLCMCTIPITSCNDPADPQVRDRILKEWNKQLLEHEKQVAQREVIKTRWAWEDDRHAVLVREWEHERTEHERELKERAGREEEERKRLNLFWDRVEAHQCKTYATREYTAFLMNLPKRWERRVEACRATALEVHGISHFPKSCEDKGYDGVVGRWEIDQHEPDCNTYWNWYKDKESPLTSRPGGCTSKGSGKRRIEHYLENLPEGGDWREFCATTPVRFHGMEFPGAQECFQYNWGTYGLWEIDDSNC